MSMLSRYETDYQNAVASLKKILDDPDPGRGDAILQYLDRSGEDPADIFVDCFLSDLMETPAGAIAVSDLIDSETCGYGLCFPVTDRNGPMVFLCDEGDPLFAERWQRQIEAAGNGGHVAEFAEITGFCRDAVDFIAARELYVREMEAENDALVARAGVAIP